LQENFRSSDGIVETARAFIAQNGNRLPKEMKPTGAQTFEAGDIAALSFNSPDEEAQYIANMVQALRGATIREDDTERGISWSDMAVLLRSVKANASPITRAFDAAGIRYVVAGMTNLFGTPEAQAVRQLFYFMASRADIDQAVMERAWQRADLGLDPSDLQRAIEGVTRSRDSLARQRSKALGPIFRPARLPHVSRGGRHSRGTRA
jgi:DNA helicase II / ATP-dependent DNA helicase PcrA